MLLRVCVCPFVYNVFEFLRVRVFVFVFCVFRFAFWLFLFLVFLCLCGFAFCVFVFCERLGSPFETYPFMIHYKRNMFWQLGAKISPI